MENERNTMTLFRFGILVVPLLRTRRSAVALQALLVFAVVLFVGGPRKKKQHVRAKQYKQPRESRLMKMAIRLAIMVLLRLGLPKYY